MKKIFTLLIIILSFVFVYNVIIKDSNINDDLNNNNPNIDTSNLVSKEEFDEFKNGLFDSNKSNFIECSELPSELKKDSYYKVVPIQEKIPFPWIGNCDFNNININNSLSNEEVDSILSKLTFYDISSLEPELSNFNSLKFYILNFISVPGVLEAPSLMILTDTNTGLYCILSNLIDSIFIYSNQYINSEINSDIYSFMGVEYNSTGFNQLAITELEIFVNNVIAEYNTSIFNVNNNGLDYLGNETNNNILSDIINYCPFIDLSPKYYFYDGFNIIDLYTSSNSISISTTYQNIDSDNDGDYDSIKDFKILDYDFIYYLSRKCLRKTLIIEFDEPDGFEGQLTRMIFHENYFEGYYADNNLSYMFGPKTATSYSCVFGTELGLDTYFSVGGFWYEYEGVMNDSPSNAVFTLGGTSSSNVHWAKGINILNITLVCEGILN